VPTTEEITPWDPASLTPIFFALLIFAALFGVAPLFFDPPSDFQPLENTAPFLASLLGIAALFFAMALGIRRFFFLGPLHRGALTTGTDEFHRRLFVSALLAWGCAQALALKGFVVFMMTYELTLHLPFVAAAFLLFALTRPSTFSEDSSK
jgi:hypothetical protein